MVAASLFGMQVFASSVVSTPESHVKGGEQ